MAKSRKAIVLVINDLVTDRRVDRTCVTLQKCNYEVLLVGRKLRTSLPMEERPYKTRRIRLIFKNQAIFYAEVSFRFLIFLLFHRADLIYVNDLDTLLPGFLVARLKSAKIIYDTHEYFTEMPELKDNAFAKKTWLCIERNILPKLKNTLTVNFSIANIYNEKYPSQRMIFVRNLPFRHEQKTALTRNDLNLPENQRVLILQGAGINMDRGAEELTLAMQFVENATLLVIGGGDVFATLEKLVIEKNLEERVRLLPKQNREMLFAYTSNTDLGLSVDKDTNLNYHYSLPNKLFDYIQAGIPVLASNLPEVRNVIETHKIGEVFQSHDPEQLALAINRMLSNEEQLLQYRKNAVEAAKILCWKTEESKLADLINNSKK